MIAQHPTAAIAAVFLFGLLVGSFLNVVILRVPPRLMWAWRREARDVLELPEVGEPEPPGIVVKGSHCPQCGHALRWYENVPLVSWLALRGRCSACKTPISAQYPIVELLTGIAFAVCVWRFGLGAEGAAAIVFTALLIALSGIDWHTKLLPDDLTYPLLWLGLAASVMTLFVPTQSAILGALAGYLSLWTVYQGFKLLTGKEGMGFGDFKLLAALGAWCGVSAILPIVLLSSLVGAVIGGAAIAIQGRDRATPIPFGPFLAIAGWIWFLFGPELSALYWGLMLPPGATAP
ncbi:A24 family peptidase [Silanimonas sp.]|uniref:prepilin peptidase n=1 Tax=Silanimonas sp. TaxID=1929290 RepID=UPI0022BB56EE|nr:A24 family peptidase [Silanimonas sp.]MCZ8115371.1 A24 family peptidase [Silanimonas sp.]